MGLRTFGFYTLFVVAGTASAQDQPAAVVMRGAQETHTYEAPLVDAIVRGQRPEYLRRILREWQPVLPSMAVGLVTGLNTASPLCPPERIWRLSGYVVAGAARIDLSVDGGAAQPDVQLMPIPEAPAGAPLLWSWCVPSSLYDGQQHRIHTQAVHSLGNVIGSLDNVPWQFTLSPPVPLAPPPIPAPTVIGNDLVGRAPNGAVNVLLVVNGSTGLPNNPVSVVNGEWRWRMAYVTPGTTASLWARARDANGVTLWEHKGSFDVPR